MACLVSTFITISLEENIDIFKKRTKNTRHQRFSDVFKSYNVLTDNIQVNPPFALLRIIEKQIKYGTILLYFIISIANQIFILRISWDIILEYFLFPLLQ